MLESHSIAEQIVIVLSGVDLARRAVFDNPSEEDSREQIEEIALKVWSAVDEHMEKLDIQAC